MGLTLLFQGGAIAALTLVLFGFLGIAALWVRDILSDLTKTGHEQWT